MWCMVMVEGRGGGGGGVELLTRDLSAEITESCNKLKKKNHCEVAV